jgi:hypothetical protein
LPTVLFCAATTYAIGVFLDEEALIAERGGRRDGRRG